MLTESLKESGAKKLRMEARSSSHSGLHVEGSFINHGLWLGESVDEEHNKEVEIELN